MVLTTNGVHGDDNDVVVNDDQYDDGDEDDE